MYMQGMPPGKPWRPFYGRIQDTTGLDMRMFGGMMPGGMMPGGMMPGGMMPGGMMPGGMMPGEMMPGEMMPGEMMPGEMMPGEMMPGEMMPEGMILPRPTERPLGEIPSLPARPLVPGRPTPPLPPQLVLPGYTPLPPGIDPQTFIRRIEEYLQDQATASTFYRTLAGQAENATIKAYLTEAADDEQKHYQLLDQLYQQLTGRAYQATPQTVQFGSLREGLLKAIDDEINAYEEYKTEYQRFSDPQMRRLFFELLSDEIEHAVRFNTALHLLQGGA